MHFHYSEKFFSMLASQSIQSPEDKMAGPASIVDDDLAAGNLRQLGAHNAGYDVDGARHPRHWVQDG